MKSVSLFIKYTKEYGCEGAQTILGERIIVKQNIISISYDVMKNKAVGV